MFGFGFCLKDTDQGFPATDTETEKRKKEIILMSRKYQNKSIGQSDCESIMSTPGARMCSADDNSKPNRIQIYKATTNMKKTAMVADGIYAHNQDRYKTLKLFY
jgi:hypothetical protein